jgi:hyperosmotically inducible periplasmic protein
MKQAHPFPLAGLVVAGASAALLACTGNVRATSDSSPSPAPYASPSPTGGDAVDKARAGAEKAGEKIKEGAQKTGEVIKDTAQDVKEKVKPAAKEAKREAKPVAKDVGEKVKEGAHETGKVLDATKQHLDVKAALMADKTVDASHIDIDTDKDAKILYLRGTVPTAAQKAAAERIAKDKADGFTVRNELTVMAKPVGK